ncbi:Uncharacterized protein TCM_045172 [Theobroma cacao]|uniref:Uncharacterized protein n=1 Tax=Theobroma cacao TaxID=3641 RepID=A0A061FRW7_THECC|nr:Uncharacterized protein TCM_045172 [Theobroma cacao]
MIFHHIIDEISASKFLTISQIRQVKLKLYRLEMTERERLTTHEQNFNQIIEDLKKLGVKMGEEQKALMFVASLPKELAHAVKSKIRNEKKLTLARVQDAAGEVRE